jgi:hypothetical protein
MCIFSAYWTTSHTSPCTSAGRLELQWTKPKLSLRWYKNKKNHFTLLLNVICLEFLDQNTFSYFLIVIIPVFPNPSFSLKKKKKNFYWYAVRVRIVLHWVWFFTEGKGRHMGLTKTKSYRCNYSLLLVQPTQEYITYDHPKKKQGPQTEI